MNDNKNDVCQKEIERQVELYIKSDIAYREFIKCRNRLLSDFVNWISDTQLLEISTKILDKLKERANKRQQENINE